MKPLLYYKYWMLFKVTAGGYCATSLSHQRPERFWLLELHTHVWPTDCRRHCCWREPLKWGKASIQQERCRWAPRRVAGAELHDLDSRGLDAPAVATPLKITLTDWRHSIGATAHW